MSTDEKSWVIFTDEPTAVFTSKEEALEHVKLMLWRNPWIFEIYINNSNPLATYRHIGTDWLKEYNLL